MTYHGSETSSLIVKHSSWSGTQECVHYLRLEHSLPNYIILGRAVTSARYMSEFGSTVCYCDYDL